METSIGYYALTSLVAGLAGAGAMELAMALIGKANWAKANMIVAVGSLITRSRQNALRTGIIVHALSAVGFALLYNVMMHYLNLTGFPTAFYAGVGFGVIHGMIVSLMLVWVVADQHPLAEFNEASFAVGLSHFAGHAAYGALVGLVIALTSSPH